jgi:hypothetical protein
LGLEKCMRSPRKLRTVKKYPKHIRNIRYTSTGLISFAAVAATIAMAIANTKMEFAS